jgi:hypothetical protein
MSKLWDRLSKAFDTTKVPLIGVALVLVAAATGDLFSDLRGEPLSNLIKCLTGQKPVWTFETAEIVARGGLFLAFAFLLGCLVDIASKTLIEAFEVRGADKVGRKPFNALVLPISRPFDREQPPLDAKTARARLASLKKWLKPEADASENVGRIGTTKIISRGALTLADLRHEEFVWTDADGAVGAFEFKNFSWQQAIRVLDHALGDTPRSALDKIYIVPSKEIEKDKHHEPFKEIIAAAAALRPNAPALEIECAPAYEDKLEDVAKILDEIVEKEHPQENKSRLVAVDITGGPRHYAAVAALIALRKNIYFLYAHEGKVDAFEASFVHRAPKA